MRTTARQDGSGREGPSWSEDLRFALHASAPVAMGYLPLGMALGALIVSLGLH